MKHLQTCWQQLLRRLKFVQLLIQLSYSSFTTTDTSFSSWYHRVTGSKGTA